MSRLNVIDVQSQDARRRPSPATGPGATGGRMHEALLPDYAIPPEVWNLSLRLADRGRASGVTVPISDLLIFACAKIHGLDVAHDDAHFDELMKLEG